MPVSRKPRHSRNVSVEGSEARTAGASKILNMVAKATQGEVFAFPRQVQHLLAYYNQQI